MKVLYFAWLRERLNRGQDNFDVPANVETIADLMTWMSDNDEATALAFADRRIIRAAIDEELVDRDASIKDAKTIAFFPPMTGG